MATNAETAKSSLSSIVGVEDNEQSDILQRAQNVCIQRECVASQ